VICAVIWQNWVPIMLLFELLRDKGILVVQASAPLQARDFRSLTATVDPYITERGQLAGLLAWLEGKGPET
jgi:hypothetical protein